MGNGVYDIVVVGGGIAGLTAATYAAQRGYKTALIEKNSRCGGLVNSFTHNGFTFDEGLRALEDAGIIFPMLKEIGVDLPRVKSSVSVGIGNRILHVDGPESLEEYEHMLVELFPESNQEIASLMRDIKSIMKSMHTLYGIENPIFKNLKKESTSYYLTLAKWFPKFLYTLNKINRMSHPVEEYLERHISNPSLRDLIGQHFFKQTPAFFALSYFSLYFDYFYPLRGTGELSRVVEQAYRDAGGEVFQERTIVQINPAERTLVDQKGNTYAYTKTIWAADLNKLYDITAVDGLSQKEQANIARQRDAVKRGRGSDSVFSLYLEVDLPAERFGAISHGHLFYTPSKLGLGSIHREELDTLLQKRNREEILLWVDRFTARNTYEISIPALRNPALAPEGKSGVILSLLMEYDLCKVAQEDGWYTELIERMEDKMIATISDSIFPFLGDAIIHRFSLSPLSIERRVGSFQGSCIGWDFASPIPAESRMLQSKKSVKTPIPHIYQAGQWAYSPGGCPMSILTGKLAVNEASFPKK